MAKPERFDIALTVSIDPSHYVSRINPSPTSWTRVDLEAAIRLGYATIEHVINVYPHDGHPVAAFPEETTTAVHQED